MKKVIEQKTDVAFYLIMYPVAHPQARESIDVALCAKTNAEKLALFEQAMEKKPLGAPSCKTEAVDRNIEFGREHHISGTPTMFLEDGTRLGGFMEADKLITILNSIDKKK